MWSVGVITYILLGGYPPFHDDNQARLFAKIKKGVYSFHPEYWSEISAEAKDLIAKMLTVDPQKRITAAQALEHPYLKVLHWGEQTWALGDKSWLRFTHALAQSQVAIRADHAVL